MKSTRVLAVGLMMGLTFGCGASKKGGTDNPDNGGGGNNDQAATTHDMADMAGCAPACGTKQCGADACGGSCGPCGQASMCDATGM